MRPRSPPTLSTYAIVFIGAIVLLFALIGRASLGRLETALQGIAASNQAAAADEVRHAVDLVVEQAQRDATRLAQWEETRQQLRNPTYYAFWRSYRLRSADIVPPYFRDAAIYDAAGQALGILPDATLPPALEPDWERPHLERRGTNDDLVLYTRTVGDSNNGIAGTIGLRIDFRDALLRLNRFHSLVETSLTLDLAEGRRYDPAEIPGAMRFRLVDRPETMRLEAVVRSALLDLAMLIGGASLVFYLLLMVLLASPLRRLCRHIDGLRTGGGGVQLGQLGGALPVAELEKVRLSLNDYQTELDGVHRDLSRTNLELWDLAHLDPLTGVHNRRAFDDDWQRLLDDLGERPPDPEQPRDVVFLLLDCNHFRSINDSYGHPVGDEVLRIIALAMQQSLRPGDRVYRLGGDEFATALSDCTRDEAKVLGGHCVAAITAADTQRLGVLEPVRVGVGLAHAQARAPADLADLHWQADAALYAAKRPGSPAVVAYVQTLAVAPKTLFSSRVANAVYEAITAGVGLCMHYQPIVELATGRVSHYEALLRISRDDEILTPYSIMPLVEARSLEVDLDRVVIAQVARDLAEGRPPAGTGVAINLSGPALLDPAILHDLARLGAFLGTHSIVIEVTETALITRLDLAGEALQRLRSAGFLVALDDFGSGYSSLRYLANMPIDLVKFDITLVRSLGDGGAQGDLVEDLARLLLKAGYQIVAEGIESEAVGRRVAALGCRYGQGYFYGRPAPACPGVQGSRHPGQAPG